MRELNIGNKAPDFQVMIAEDKYFCLSEFIGKYIVLYFYPKDNTPGCNIEAQEFNLLFPEFQMLRAEIIGVSKDSLKSHDRFKDLLGLKFYLGADMTCNLCQKYGVLVEKSMFGKKYMGITRMSFLIDKEGNIAFIWHKVKIEGHAQEVLDKIKELEEISRKKYSML